MKKVFFLLLALFPVLSYAQDDLTLEEVLNNYYEAAGLNNYKNVNTIVFKGKMVMQGMEFPITLYKKRQDKIRTETEFQGNKIISAFDGKNGWSINPMAGTKEPQDMDAKQAKQMKEQADMEGILYNYKDKGYKAELDGTEEVEGSDAYVIHLVKQDSTKEKPDEFWYYLDAETFIPIKVKGQTTLRGQEVTSETYFSNYKQINGIAFPMLMTIGSGGRSMQYVIDSVEINIDVPDSLFVKPEK